MRGRERGRDREGSEVVGDEGNTLREGERKRGEWGGSGGMRGVAWKSGRDRKRGVRNEMLVGVGSNF